MPLDQPPLYADDVQVVVDWICQGDTLSMLSFLASASR
jgi:hypothetical protein